MEGVIGIPINFHDEKNRHAYTTRSADESWKGAMRSLLDPMGGATCTHARNRNRLRYNFGIVVLKEAQGVRRMTAAGLITLGGILLGIFG